MATKVTTTCLTCGEQVSRTYNDQRWTGAKGDVCFKKTDLNRLHDVSTEAFLATLANG